MRTKLLAIIALVWFVVVICAYYVYHKPFSLDTAIIWLNAFRDIGLAFVIISVGGGVGSIFLQDATKDKISIAVLQVSLGLGLLGVVLLVMGALGGFQPWSLGLLILILALVTHRQVYVWWYAWKGVKDYWLDSNLFGKAMSIGILGLVLLSLSVALAPPVKFDALVYHLVLPWQYLEAGGLIFTGGNIFWGMPQLGEMLYTLASGIGNPSSATTLGWAIGLLCLVGILSYLRKRFSLESGWVGVFSMLAGITLVASLAWGYVEWWSALFGLGFLVALDEWVVERSNKYLRLGGIFAGFALGTKYSAGVLALSGLFIIFWHLRKEKAEEVIINLLRYSLWVLIVAFPWFLKNFITTGNPIYPFIFPTEVMNEIRLAFYQNRVAWGSWQEVFLLPLRATLIGVEGSPGYNASIGPIMLAFGGLFWLGWRQKSQAQRNAIINALWIFGPTLAIWVIGSRSAEYLIQTRLYFTIFPAITVLVAAGFESIKVQKVSKLYVGLLAKVMILLVLIMLLSQLWTDMMSKGSLQRLSGLRTGREYLVENLGFYTIVVESIRNTPEIESVLMLWEPRSFYCYQKCDPDEVLDQWWQAIRMWNQPEIILDRWWVNGYTHILLNRQGVEFIQDEDERYFAEDWETLDNLLRILPAPTIFGQAYELYRLNP